MPRGCALILLPEAPYPTHGGGALRAASVLAYLARRYDIDVLVFREAGAPHPAALFPVGLARQIHVLDLPQHRKGPIPRALRNAGRIAREVPPLIDRFTGFAGPISAFVRGRRYEVGVIEHFWCAPYWQQIAPVSRRTVLNLYDIESVLHKRCARIDSSPQALAHSIFHRAARAMENLWLPRYDEVLTASLDDAEIAQTIAPKTRVTVYPNAIPFVLQPEVVERNVVAFSGNLEYHPNVSAVRYFRAEIWPLLRDKWPSLVWRLIGKNPGCVRQYTSGEARIELSGPVESAIDELASAKVVVVPVLAGSGTRLKIIEAWAAGRAVVSTTVGAEGLPARHGKNLLIADEVWRFVDSVSLLLTDAALRIRLGETGRRLFESEFTWESAWQKLDL